MLSKWQQHTNSDKSVEMLKRIRIICDTDVYENDLVICLLDPIRPALEIIRRNDLKLYISVFI